MRHPMCGPSFSLRASVAAAFLLTGLAIGAGRLLELVVSR